MDIDIKESQNLLTCLETLNHRWKQKDLEACLLVAQSHISRVRAGRKKFSRPTRELTRYRIRDRIAEIVGSEFTYNQISLISGYFENLCAGDYTSEDIVKNQAYREFTIAERIYKSGFFIG
jgi:hypothetical protein